MDAELRRNAKKKKKDFKKDFFKLINNAENLWKM